MLRKRGRGVASKSQHTFGKALDFYLPDVRLSKLRRIALIKQVGGVGYYPKSGSPFIHLDTGRVRHWPRMTRSQLVRVFPQGKTLHVPSDGRPLKGFSIAKANFNKRKRGQGKIVVSNEKILPKKTKPKKPSLFQRLVGADEREDRDNVTTPAPKPVKTTPQPVPVVKPKDIPAVRPEQEPEGTTQIAALPVRVPVPSVAPRKSANEPPVIVAALSERLSATETDTQPESAAPEGEVASDVTAIPDKRPEIEPVEDQSILLALADPNAGTNFEIPTPKFKVLALSAVEIENLRGQFTDLSANSVSGADKVVPVPRPSLVMAASQETGKPPKIEIPANAVAVASLEPVVLRASASAIVVPSASENLSVEPAEVAKVEERLKPEVTKPEVVSPAEPVIALASLQLIEPSVVSRGLTGLPLPNPERKLTVEKELLNEQSEPVQVASLTPIEPGTRSSDEIALPVANPVRLALAELAERRQTEEAASLQLASLNETISPGVGTEISIPDAGSKFSVAIPSKRPKLPQDAVLLASLESDLNNSGAISGFSDAASNSQTVGRLRQRTTSLAKFSMPDLEKNAIGKWALANGKSIREIAEIRPPAYGRNAIRELPSTVLTAGFSLDLELWPTTKFSGSAVEFLAFAKFDN